MTLMLLTTLLMGAEPMDALFPLATEQDLHLYPSRFAAAGKPLDDKRFAGGPWFPGLRVKLSDDCTGYVVFDGKDSVELVVLCKQAVTETLPLASFKRLAGAYEKTTNSWLRLRTGTWELVTSTFLRDFEFDAPGAKNITGHDSSVRAFRKGRFEYVSNQLPPSGPFSIKR